MGRRPQGSTRTLNRQIRHLFTPVLTVFPRKDATSVNNEHKEAAPGREDAAEQSVELISTQPPDLPSEKSLGKRKRVEIDEEPARNGINDESEHKPAETRITETNYTKANMPAALQKYWHQRHRLFSRYDFGIQMDYDGWFSVTPEKIAAQIAERCRCDLVVDAFCGVGGNAIQFAAVCEKVIAIDISPIRLACARANAKVYGVEDRITFIQADFTEWARARAAKADAQIDVVFLSPPWGGIDYQDDTDDPDASILPAPPTPGGAAPAQPPKSGYASYPLSRLAPLHGKELFDLSRKLTKNVAYFLPRNLNVAEAARLAPAGEKVEVEEAWMGSKLKALTVYYGDLVADADR